jgi:hypothetical protein
MMPTDSIPTPPSAVVVSGTAYTMGQTLQTKHGQPDIVITVITPLVAILVRAAKAYLQTLLGLLSASAFGMAATVLPAGDFLHTLTICAGLSVASGVMSLLTNVSVLLTALGDRFPILKT